MTGTPGSHLRIGLLIRSLTVGGAERQLVSLAVGLREAGQDVTVFVYYRSGSFLEDALARAQVPLVDLGKGGRWDAGFLGRLISAVRRADLDVVYSFLPTSNVLAALLWGGRARPALVWGVRGAMGRESGREWLGDLIVRTQDIVVPRAAAVIANSMPAIEGCKRRGWPARRLHMVANGLDVDAFRFDADARARVRAAWGVQAGCRIIGAAGRIDPVKDLESLLDAFARLAGESPALRLVVAGEGRHDYLAQLHDMARSLGIADRVLWLGLVADMRGFYSAIDLLCLPSRSEGCSNVVAESLACGTPVVATRVGDNPVYVLDQNMLATSGNRDELATALRYGLDRAGEEDRQVLREQILGQLAVSVLVDKTLSVLRIATAT